MIIFEKIRYKNFLSSGNSFTELNLVEHNSTLIIGKNGSGKSTFLDALSFALFGVEFRDINKPQLVNSINKKGLLVEIEFSIGSSSYMIRRGMKPTIFEIWKDDKMINQEADGRDYQKYLETSIIKMNTKSFRQIVVLGSVDYTPFMKLKGPERRIVVEDFLDLQIFSIMNAILKKKVDSNKENIKDYTSELRILEETIIGKELMIEKLSYGSKDRILALQKKLISANEQLINYQAELDCLNISYSEAYSNIQDVKGLSSRRDKMSLLLSQLRNQYNKNNQDISFYETNDSCPTCKQDIDLEFKSDIVGNKSLKKQDILAAIDKLSQQISDMDIELQKNIDNKRIVDELSSAKSRIQAYMSSVSAYIQEINNDISRAESDAQSDVSEEIVKLNNLKSQKQFKDNERGQLLLDREVLDIAATLLKDGGIKSKIIKKYIPIINKLIRKYLAILDLPVGFELDETFKETIKSRFRDEFSYGSFSEGEKKRLDLALLFTWRDISKLRNSVNTNLLVMDEIMDGALDTDGVDQLAGIISKSFKNTNIFVISHRESMLEGFDNVIKFEKVHDFSRITDYEISK